jgi:hypothetical protein
MKKIVLVFVTFLLIFTLAFLWYRNVKNNLISLDEKVNISLESLICETDKRYIYLDSVLTLDSLKKNNLELKSYIDWRNSRNKIVSVKYLDMEYGFDSLLIEISKDKYDANSLFILTKKEYDTRLNHKAEQYNLSLKKFYQYDLFPKSLVTNQLNIGKKSYFEFRYGEVSERPSLKDARTSKEIDSLLIKGLE